MFKVSTTKHSVRVGHHHDLSHMTYCAGHSGASAGVSVALIICVCLFLCECVAAACGGLWHVNEAPLRGGQ